MKHIPPVQCSFNTTACCFSKRLCWRND